MGLWPLQVIVLAAVLGKGSGDSRPIFLPLLITGAVLANPFVLSRAEAWRRDGWSGVDSVETRIADYLAQRLRADGKDRAAIGYRLFLDGPPEPPWKAVDNRWRVGGDVDVILEFRHGIKNLNACAESVSAQDEYRIVETYPPEPQALYYFDVPPARTLRFLDRIGPFDVYKTDRPR